jgi:hypothetical protein
MTYISEDDTAHVQDDFEGAKWNGFLDKQHIIEQSFTVQK